METRMATATSSPSTLILNLKCFLCTRQFEGSKARSSSGTGLETAALLTHSWSSFLLTKIFGIRSNGQKISRKDLNRLTIKFQKVCYCSQCLELILNVSRLMTELEMLEEKVSTEKKNIVDKLKESCAKFTEKSDNQPPGMLQTLRNEVLEEINKNINRRSVRLRESPTKIPQNQNVSLPEEVKIPNRLQCRSTQTENIISAAHYSRRPTRKGELDLGPENSPSSLNSGVVVFGDDAVDHEEVNLLNSNRNSKEVSKRGVIISVQAAETKALQEKSQDSKPNNANLKQKPKVLKQDSKRSKQGVQLSQQNPKVSKAEPQILRQDSVTTLKRKLKIPRGQGKVKRQRHKSLISGVKRTSPFYFSKKCEECGKVLSNHDKWKDHVLTIHRGEGRFNCKLCNFKCQFPSKLKRHMTNRHSETRNFTCDLCGKTFKRKDTLQAHKKIHTGETSYECKLCSCKFKFAVSLRMHQLERACLNTQSQTCHIPPRKRARQCRC